MKKRILSWLLAFLLVIGLLPGNIIEVQAYWCAIACQGDLPTMYKNKIELVEYNKNGESKMGLLDYCNLMSFSRNGSTVTVKFRAYATSGSDSLLDKTFSFEDPDCTLALDTIATYSSNNGYSAKFTIKRPAGSHKGNANCSQSAVCSICGKTYQQADGHSYQWKSNDTQHWKECAYNSSHIANKGYHSGGTATCTGQAQCTTCGAKYGSAKKHEYVYTVNENTITEKCSNGCGHIATADIKIDDSVILSYTGLPIKPLQAVYSDGWVGAKSEVSYADACIIPGEHFGSISVGDKTIGRSFIIAIGKMQNLTVDGYSGAYDGQPHSITVKGYPDGATITYSTSENGAYTSTNPTYTEIGTNTVYYKVENENYNAVTGSATVTISQATNEWAVKPSITGWTYGQAANTPNKGKPMFGNDVKVEYKSANADDTEYSTTVPTQAGNYKARFSVEGNENYTSLSTEIDFEIAKAKLTVKADDKSKTYGEKDPLLTWTLTGKPVGEDELTGITVKRANGENAKAYTITASQADNANPNYDITFETGTFTINKKTIGISWGNTTFTYDGNEKCPTATATGVEFDDEIKLTVDGTKTNAGTEYTATVTGITGEKSGNYQLPKDATTAFVINKADQSAPSGLAGTPEDIDGKENGKITGLTDKMEYRKNDEISYTAIIGTELTGLADGVYYVRYKEDNNHNASPDKVITLSNDKKLNVTIPETQVGYTLTVSNSALKWNESTTVTFTVKDGYSRQNGFAVMVNGEPIELDKDGKYTRANVTENLNVTVVGVADTTAPDVEITLGTNTWNKLFNNITFGLFFKDTQKVTITAKDAGSGVDNDKIYYYLATESLTEEQVKNIDGWTKYKGEFDINPQEEYIIYVKASDKAGNTAYVSSEKGIVVDSILPAISGIVDGETHYGDTTFAVTDKHLKEVRVDGNPVTLAEGKYTIKADGDEHTVVAADKSGNSSEEIRINVITISALDDNIESITTDNVKSSDKTAIEDVQSFVNGLIESGKDFTDTENAQLCEIKENTENLLKKLDDIENEIKDITDSVNAYETDRVKSDDKQDIQDLIDRIDSLNETENITETEKSELEEVKTTANEFITKIDNTANDVKDLTDNANAYDKDKVTSDDKKNIEDLITEVDKLLNGENLNDSEKEDLGKVKDIASGLIERIDEATDSFKTDNTDKVKDTTADNVTTDDKSSLEKAKDELEKTLTDYKDNLTEDEKNDIEKEIERIEKALEVIDRVENAEDIIGKLPSTITKDDADAIKKAADAYNALSKYEQSVLNKDVKQRLENAKAALEKLNTTVSSLSTGDNSHIRLWFVLFMLSGCTLIVITVYRRKKKYSVK